MLGTISPWASKHFTVLGRFRRLHLPIPPVGPPHGTVKPFRSQAWTNVGNRYFHPALDFARTLWLFFNGLVGPQTRRSLILGNYFLDCALNLVFAKRALGIWWIFCFGFIARVEWLALVRFIGRSRGKFTFFLAQWVHFLVCNIIHIHITIMTIKNIKKPNKLNKYQHLFQKTFSTKVEESPPYYNCTRNPHLIL